jgi:hypothetical protein
VARPGTPIEAHFYETGNWSFATDAPFDANNAATWPFAFVMQTNGSYDLISSAAARAPAPRPPSRRDL